MYLFHMEKGLKWIFFYKEKQLDGPDLEVAYRWRHLLKQSYPRY